MCQVVSQIQSPAVGIHIEPSQNYRNTEVPLNTNLEPLGDLGLLRRTLVVWGFENLRSWAQSGVGLLAVAAAL